MKKQLMSASLALTMLASLLPVSSVGASADYSDWTPPAKTENMISDATEGYGSKYMGTKPHPYITSTYDFSNRTIKYVYDGGDYKESLQETQPAFKMQLGEYDTGKSYYEIWKVFGGFESKGDDFGFSPAAGETYVIHFNLKNISDGDQVLKFGSAMARSYNGADSFGTNEYGKEGMTIGKDWTSYDATITLPSDWLPRDEAIQAWGGAQWYYNRIYSGMQDGSAYGTGFEVDASTKDSFYFAKEQRYDITNSLNKATIGQGGTITANAAVINQVGIPGTLSQNFEWFVTDAGRNEIINGITITPSADTKSATIEVSDSVPAGDYVLIAHSTDYTDMYKGAAFSVTESVDYSDYIPGAMPENIIPSNIYAKMGFSAPSGGAFDWSWASGEDASANGISENQAFIYKYVGEGTYNFLEHNANEAWRGTAGVEFNGMYNQNLHFDFVTEADTTYVFRAKVKDASIGEGETHFNISMNNTYSPAQDKRISTDNYGLEGMKLSKEWQYFADTITTPSTWLSQSVGKVYNEGTDQEYTKYLRDCIFAGFADNVKEGTRYLLNVTDDRPYLAKEAAYDITNTIDKNTVGKGGKIYADAKVLDQIGIPGKLSQNFDWVVVDENRENEVEGFTITKNEATGSAVVDITSESPVGNFVLIAKSTDYNMIKGASFTVENKKDWSDTPSAAIPDNLITATSYLEPRNEGSIDMAFPTDSEAADFGLSSRYDAYYWKYTGSDTFNPGNVKPFRGFEINSYLQFLSMIPNFEFEPGENYILKIKMKDVSTGDGQTVFGASLSKDGTGNEGTEVYTNHYPDGLSIGKDWTEYYDTFTIPNDWKDGSTPYRTYTSEEVVDGSTKVSYTDENGNQGTATKYTGNPDIPYPYTKYQRDTVYCGLTNGTKPGTAFLLDRTEMPYFAKEVAYKINNTADKDTLKAGQKITANANLINQFEQEGDLDQTISWIVLDENRENELNIPVEVSADTKTASVTATAEMIGNNYVLVAYSEKYGSIKGVPFEVVETPEFSISDALVEYEAGEFQVSIAVENADTENVLFAAAAYDETGKMIYVTSVTVPVVNGVASTSELASEEPIEGVAVLKAFAWDAAAQKPAANPKGFELTVDA